jgi:hypothetical protein
MCLPCGPQKFRPAQFRRGLDHDRGASSRHPRAADGVPDRVRLPQNEPVSFSRHGHHRLHLCGDVARFVSAAVRSHTHLAAENLFLRKQLALYVERQVKPRRADDATRMTLVALSSLVDWRRILTVVQPPRS